MFLWQERNRGGDVKTPEKKKNRRVSKQVGRTPGQGRVGRLRKKKFGERRQRGGNPSRQKGVKGRVESVTQLTIVGREPFGRRGGSWAMYNASNRERKRGDHAYVVHHENAKLAKGEFLTDEASHVVDKPVRYPKDKKRTSQGRNRRRSPLPLGVNWSDESPPRMEKSYHDGGGDKVGNGPPRERAENQRRPLICQ